MLAQAVPKLLNVTIQAIAVHDHIDLADVLTISVRRAVLAWVTY